MSDSNKLLWQQRLKAFLGHLIFSFVLLIIALYLIYQVWYPNPLVKAMGVMQIYVIVLSIDLIMGPFLTAIVYKNDKKVLIRDVAIIILLQLVAFFYGLYTIAQGRPAFQVFVVDDVELVSPVSVKTAELKQDIPYHLLSKPLWIAAPFSDNLKLAHEQKQDEIVHGKSMVFRTEYYRPIQEHSAKVVNKLRNLEELKQSNSAELVQKSIEQYSDAIGWLPVKAPEVDMVAIYDRNGQPLGIVDLRPW